MKDKKRRTYGFLTGLLLILSVCLTSCGNQGQTDSGKDSNTQSGTKVAARKIILPKKRVQTVNPM